jgi:hypothetical protein
MTTPVVVVLVSTNRNVPSAPPSAKRRRPDPKDQLVDQEVLVGPPGACMTPSSVTLLFTTTLLI